jgi:hypothetical protein
LLGGVRDGRVDVLAAGVDLLLHTPVGLEPRLLECGLDRALADDEQARLTPASISSPNSLTSERDMPFHRWPLTPPRAPPTAADARIEGGNSSPTSAPAAIPPHVPCRVAVSSLLTCTLPSSSLVITAASYEPTRSDVEMDFRTSAEPQSGQRSSCLL